MKKGTVLVSGQVPVLNDAKEGPDTNIIRRMQTLQVSTTLEYEENCDDYYEEKEV